MYSLVDSDSSSNDEDSDHESWLAGASDNCDATQSNWNNDVVRQDESWDDPDYDQAIKVLPPAFEPGQFSDASESCDEIEAATGHDPQISVAGDFSQVNIRSAQSIDHQEESCDQNIGSRETSDGHVSPPDRASSFSPSTVQPGIEDTRESSNPSDPLAKSLIICRGCGCRMTQLIRGDNLCGFDDRCRSSFAEMFRSMQASRFTPSVYYNQFDDAED